MAEQEVAESETRRMDDGFPDEIARLLHLVKRLEHENTALRRELATRRIAA